MAVFNKIKSQIKLTGYQTGFGIFSDSYTGKVMLVIRNGRMDRMQADHHIKENASTDVPFRLHIIDHFIKRVILVFIRTECNFTHGSEQLQKIIVAAEPGPERQSIN